ncbi:MAG: sulfite exporter TauE/SafE family protein [Leptospirales bacterium]|nr:sulfite exporter TauE/SafE family protein [Leptospirales bacterium]
MSFEYWYLFFVAIAVATTANASGFSGGVLFQPIYNLFINIPMASSVATGVATETIGMTSGSIRYLYNKMVDLPIAFTIIMLCIPGIVLGSHALAIMNGNILKILLGFIILFLATVQLVSAIQKKFGQNDRIPIENIYPYMWIPPLSGFFTTTTGTGIAEMNNPLMDKVLNLKTKRANATAIFIEAATDWVITILNLHGGLVVLEIWMFTAPGVIIGAQLGAWVSKYLPERLLKISFSMCIVVIGVFYLYRGIEWLIAAD